MFAVLVAVYLTLFFVCALASSKREGYWSPVTIFGISAFYYYLSVPFEFYLRNEEVFTTYPSVCGISPDTRNAIGILALLAFVGFVAGHWSSGLGRLIAAADVARPVKIPKSLQYAAFGTVLLLLVIYRSTIFEQLAYEEANERRYNDPIFGYLTRLCLLLACLIAGIMVQRRGLANVAVRLLELHKPPAGALVPLQPEFGHAGVITPILPEWRGRRSGRREPGDGLVIPLLCVEP